MNSVFIILSAGQGKRFGLDYNKLLFKINNKPLIYYLLLKLHKINDLKQMILVVNPSDFKIMKNLVQFYKFNKIIKIIKGGEERYNSVFNALKWVKKNLNTTDLIVGIHDGARLNISQNLILKLMRSLKKNKGIIPVIKVTDTIKEIKQSRIIKTLNRENLYQIQTPQFYKFKPLFDTYIKAIKTKFHSTDDASILEYSNYSVKCIEGENKNIKLTYIEDVEKMFNRKYKIGIGMDVHQFAPNRKLILGGVQISYKFGLAGHSDADVLIHAIMDSLLGAAGLNDIGVHFPDSDKKYKNIDSSKLLKKVLIMIQQKNYNIDNIDTIIIAQEPKISPYVEKIKKRLSLLLNLDIEKINIKATTTEKLGFIGRKEGIAVQSIALLESLSISS